jgi:long-chain fatty acid transport protein
MLLKRALVVLVALLVCTVATFGGGYQVNEHGARAMGMGGAFVAQAADGSAIFFNPAGLGFQKGLHIMAGTTVILPSTKFSASTETSMNSLTFFPSNAYVTYGMDNGLSFGIGMFNPYGLGTEWPSNWAGRQQAVKTDLQTFYINPTIAYQVSDRLSIGFGFSYVFGNVKLTERVPTLSALAPAPTPAANDGTISLDGDGHDFNWNVGVLYKPTKDLSIGVSYRSETKVEFSGTAAFTDMQAIQALFPGGTGKTTLPFPSSLYAGIAYNFTEDLTLEADIQLVGWSAYDKLLLNIPVGPASPLTGQPLQGPTTLVKNWKNSSLYRVGGEYRMEKLAIRAGVIYDQTPQPDAYVEPMLPDANRIEFVAGLGYKLSDNFTIDGAFQFISFSDRTGTVTSKTALYPFVPAQNVKGTYKSSANLIGVDLSYNF